MSGFGFDLESAESLLPTLERLLQVAIEAKKRLTELAREQKKAIEYMNVAGGTLPDLNRIARWKNEKVEAVKLLRESVTEIEEMGCLVKDLDMGLVDFPCRVNGEEVYLCWKLGERAIEHWHATDEGFAGRKRIDDKFIRELHRSRVH